MRVLAIGARCGASLTRAAHVDVHTGLGRRGVDTLLVTDGGGAASAATSAAGAPPPLASVCALLGGDGTVDGAALLPRLETVRMTFSDPPLPLTPS